MHVLMVICEGGWMPAHLSEGWRRLGWEVEEFFYGTHMGRDWGASGRRANRAVNRALLDTARSLRSEGRLDLVFCVIYDDVLEVETARALRALGAPLVNYHVDLSSQWYRVLRTGPYFDRVACSTRHHLGALRRRGVRTFHMPLASNPDPDPTCGEASAAAIATPPFDGVQYLGSPWPWRRRVLRAVHAQGFALRILGHNWHRPPASLPGRASPVGKLAHDVAHYLWPRLREEGPGRFVSTLVSRRRLRRQEDGGDPATGLGDCVAGSYEQARFGALVRAGAVNLGFTHVSGEPGSDAEQRHLRLRDVEVPMAGGFYLVEACHDFEDLYADGVHVATWDGIPDLLEKVAHYLQAPAERERIARAGRRHCLERHTWAERFGSLCVDLGIGERAP